MINQQGNKEVLLSARELVLQNIFLYWIDVQNEFEQSNKVNSYPLSRLILKLNVLYYTMLRAKMMKFRKKKEKNEDIDDIDKIEYLFINKNPSKEDVLKVIMIFDEFFERSKLFNIGYEVMPYDRKFSASY